MPTLTWTHPSSPRTNPGFLECGNFRSRDSVVIFSLIIGVLYAALLIYLLVMWARFIIDVVRSVNRGWRPQGFLLVVSEFSYLVTDPPIRFVRRLIPPVRVGGMALDFAWSIVMLVVIILIIVIGSLQ